jgi:hypothetical protein
MTGATPTVPRDGYLLLQEVIQHLSRERERLGMRGATPTVPRDGYLLLQEVIQHLDREREVKDGRSHVHCPQGW